MPENKRNTPFKRYTTLIAFFVLSGAVSLLAYKTLQNEEILISIEDVAISIDKPIEFQAYLRAGDQVKLELNQQKKSLIDNILKRVNISTIEVILTNKNPKANFRPELLDQIELATAGKTIEDDAWYTLRVNGLRKRDMEMGEVRFTLLSGTVGDTIEITTLHVGEEETQRPKIRVDLTEEDILKVKGNSQTQRNIRFDIPEMSAYEEVAWQRPVKAQGSGFFTIDLFSDGRSVNANITVERTRPVPEEPEVVLSEDPEDEEVLVEGGEEEEKDPIEALLEFMEAQAQVQTAEVPISTIDDEITMTLPPKLALGAKNKKCESIDIPPESQFWSYWIGVGDDNMDYYDDEEENQVDRFNDHRLNIQKGFQAGTILQVQAFKLIDNPTKLAPLLRPRRKRSVKTLPETVEYAILSASDTTAFFAGQYKGRTRWSGFGIDQDHGNDVVDNRKELFLCACNNNKHTKVELTFRYEAFIKELVELP